MPTSTFGSGNFFLFILFLFSRLFLKNKIYVNKIYDEKQEVNMKGN